MSISDADNYRLDPNRFLGNKYSSYKQRVLAYSVSDPSGFLKLRENVINAIKTETVHQFYSNIFTLLSEGKTCDAYGNATGSSIVELPGVSEENRAVSYPSQEINKLALSIASTVDEFLDKICNIILPDEYLDNVRNAFITKSKANIISG
jgi:hypothetical protein